jgi:hypothetical protein
MVLDKKKKKKTMPSLNSQEFDHKPKLNGPGYLGPHVTGITLTETRLTPPDSAPNLRL